MPKTSKTYSSRFIFTHGHGVLFYPCVQQTHIECLLLKIYIFSLILFLLFHFYSRLLYERLDFCKIVQERIQRLNDADYFHSLP